MAAPRKLERQLIADYEASIQQFVATLSEENHGIALALANLPETIRGFGHVKLKSIHAATAKRAALLEQLAAGKPQAEKAA